MTLEEIADAAQRALPGAVVEVDGSLIHVLDYFSVAEDEETHDAARALSVDMQEALADVGLSIEEMDSDNDSVWGVIVEAQKS